MLTDNQLAEYRESGFLNAIRVHAQEEADNIRTHFDALEQQEGKAHCQIGLQGRHIDIKFIWQLATSPKILDCMESLLGPDVMLLSTHVFCKYPDPEPSKFVAWHQDVTYWGLEPPEATTAWYAIDDADEENGCMQVIPGSHKKGILEHGTSTKPGNLLSINQEVKEVDDSNIVNLAMKAGEISIHDGFLIHGSGPNVSTRRRCGVTLRYCTPNVKPVTANSINTPWPSMIVRGEDRYGHFGEWELQHTAPPHRAK